MPSFPAKYAAPLVQRPLSGPAAAIVDDAKMCFELWCRVRRAQNGSLFLKLLSSDLVKFGDFNKFGEY